MEKEDYADKTPYPPGNFKLLRFYYRTLNFLLSLLAVIPMVDSEHVLIKLQFAIDPGEDFLWEENEPISESSRLNLSYNDKLVLLHEYLDITYVPIPPEYRKEVCYLSFFNHFCLV